MEKNKKISLIDPLRLKDPMFWFMKASAYCSASLYILGAYKEIKSGDKITHLFNAINSTPYLTGLAAELYMKGYLVSKGIDPITLRDKNIGHDLKILRKKCLKYGDPRFKNTSLTFLTDTLGKHIMEDGGIRYPEKKPVAIYISEFDNALKVLKRISSEVAREITDRKKQKQKG